MTRVLGGGRDFGPGWRLSLAEELTAVDGGLIYTDGSGARHFFRLASPNERGRRSEPLVSGQPVQIDADGSRVRPSLSIASGRYAAYPETPKHAATAIEIIGPLAVVQDGQTTRVFERNRSDRPAYVLRSMTSGGETLALSYWNGRIREVSDSAGVVFSITRDRVARIVSVQDRWGRAVQYGYDAAGRLTETLDMAGNVWRYEYGSHGRLTRAIGPNGKDILRMDYDASGRVIQSHSGREYSFAYAPNETVVKEGVGHVHRFGHNAAGVTNRFDSTNGNWWWLTLDGRNRVTAIQSSNGEHRFDYGLQGQVVSVVEANANGIESRAYQHDEQGRIVSVYSQDGAFTTVDYAGGVTRINGPEAPFGFEVSSSGQIAQVEQDGRFIGADYDVEGNLAAFQSGASTVKFNHDFMGRVSDIEYADGEVNQYSYDALGNRSSIDFGLGGAVRYSHDPAGNIVEVVVTERDGEVKRQFVQIGDMNRVENITYEGLGALDITYDEMGRAVTFDTGRDVISVEYAGPDRIGRIDSRATGATWTSNEDGEGEPNIQSVTDARREVLQNDAAGTTHPDYGIVAFDGISFAVNAQDPMELGVPGLLEARQVLAVAEPLLSGKEHGAMMEFEKPSNGVFQPLEYRSTNCCVCIITYPKSLIRRDVDDDGETELICICLPNPSPPPRPSIGVGLSKNTVWPLETGRPEADSQATITVSSSNVSQGTAVSIQLLPGSTGGHAAHKGQRPLGTVTPQSGQINAQGNFTAEFTARQFGGDIRINVTVGELSSTRTLQVRVPNLSLMAAGEGYRLVGSITKHPTAWHATSTVKSKLKKIAKAYKDEYWSDTVPQPDAKRVGYNDISLIYGGKFELPGNWCIEDSKQCRHEGHRVGTHVDARRRNMTATQQAKFADIAEDNDGDPQVHSQGTPTEHWHLQF